MRGYVMNRESLKRHCEEMCKRFGASDVPYTSGTYGEHRLVLELLEQTEWIPVGERLPKVGHRVIFNMNNDEIYIGTLYKWDNDLKISLEPTGIGYVYSFENVTAWMPLPKPYKAGEEE